MAVLFDDVFASALQLSPQERLRLIAQVSQSVEKEFTHESEGTELLVEFDDPNDWGRELATFILATDTSAWQKADEFEDANAWVRQFRQNLDGRHDAYWRGDE